jgi:hypothetical protein
MEMKLHTMLLLLRGSIEDRYTVRERVGIAVIYRNRGRKLANATSEELRKCIMEIKIGCHALHHSLKGACGEARENHQQMRGILVHEP